MPCPSDCDPEVASHTGYDRANPLVTASLKFPGTALPCHLREASFQRLGDSRSPLISDSLFLPREQHRVMAVKVELGRGRLSSPQLLSKVSYSRTNSGSREFMPKNKTDQVQSSPQTPPSQKAR